MSTSSQEHRAAAIGVSMSAVALFKESGILEIAERLSEILDAASQGKEDQAFHLIRQLPQYDVADFWSPLEWEPSSVSSERRALLTSYYQAAFTALTNWRVVTEHQFEREVTDISAAALEAHAVSLLTEKMIFNPSLHRTASGGR